MSDKYVKDLSDMVYLHLFLHPVYRRLIVNSHSNYGQIVQRGTKPVQRGGDPSDPQFHLLCPGIHVVHQAAQFDRFGMLNREIKIARI